MTNFTKVYKSRSVGPSEISLKLDKYYVINFFNKFIGHCQVFVKFSPAILPKTNPVMEQKCQTQLMQTNSNLTLEELYETKTNLDQPLA